MNRWLALCLPALLAAGIAVARQNTPTAVASDCRRTTVNLTPVTELDRYQGYLGGLYVDGLNVPPSSHLDLARARAAAIKPRHADGSVAGDGRIVLLAIGTSVTTMEYQAFMSLAQGDTQINPAVLLVDGAVNGQDSEAISDGAAPYWSTVDERLLDAGASRQQVQVIWLKELRSQPSGAFPESAEALRDDLVSIVQILHERFPNLKLAYLSSRIYAGYATSRLSPEPFAYESAFAVRWVIERQIGGDPGLNPDAAKGEVKAPVLLWGPYMWADGTTGRADGLVWRCEDFRDDGTHPGVSGLAKVANMLMAFFKTDETTRTWFMSEPDATPLPSATIPAVPTAEPPPTRGPRPSREPQPTPLPTITPGGPTVTPNPTVEAMRRSYLVSEVPSGDQIWVSTTNRFIQMQLERLTMLQPMWLCGPVVVDSAAQWGFRFEHDMITLARDAPRGTRTTIRDVAADPQARAERRSCIRISGATEYVEGTPPPPGTPGTPIPTSALPTFVRPSPGTGTAFPTRQPSRTPSASVPIPEGPYMNYLPFATKYK